MNVYVVTECEHSDEGLEGCFDVYLGLAPTLRLATCIIDSGKAVWDHPVRYEITKMWRGVVRVKRFDTRPKYRWEPTRNGGMVRVSDGTWETATNEWLIKRETL